MKVLIITIDYPPPYGGIASFTRTLELQLQRNHIETRLLNFDSRNTNNFRNVRARDLIYSESTFNRYFNPLSILNPFNLLSLESGYRSFVFSNMINRETKNEIRLFDPDVVHLVHGRIFTSVFNCKKPVLITCHSEEIISSFPIQYVLEHSSMIHCVSNFTKEKVLKIVPNRSRDISVLHNSIDVESYYAQARTTFRLITICRLDIAKNVISVVDALSHLPKETLKNLKYDIIGIGEAMEDILNLVRVRKLEETVVFHGSVSEEKKRKLLSQASVFIMCPVEHKGKQEGFGIVYLEAQASLLPIIASKTGGVPEAVGDSGLFVLNPHDPIEISEKIQELYENKVCYRRLQENCMQNRRNFDHSVWIHKIIQMYKDL